MCANRINQLILLFKHIYMNSISHKILLFLSLLTIQTFGKTFGGPGLDHGYEMIKTADGGYALLGESDSLGSDIFMIKVDALANLQWSKKFGTPNSDDYASSLVQTSDGGFLVIGTYTDPTFSLRAWLLRLNSSGDTIWTKKYYDASSSLQTGSYVDIYNNQYTIGINSDAVTAGSFLYLYRTDTMGNILSTLSTSTEFGKVLPIDNGYLMTATNSTFPPPSINIFRLDTVGSLSFDKYFSDPGFTRSLRAYSSAICGTGFLTVGSTDLYSANVNENNFYLLKTNSTGDSIWSRSWGPAFSSLNTIIRDNASNYLISGSIDSSGHRKDFIWRTDSLGDTLWTKYIGDNLTISSIINIGNGNFSAIGDSIDPMTGLTDVWVMLYDSLGNQILNPSTGLNQSKWNSDFAINVFPNPSKNHISIDYGINFSSIRGYKLRINNSEGRTVFMNNISQQYLSIDIHDWKDQIYFLCVSDLEGRTVDVKRFIKN